MSAAQDIFSGEERALAVRTLSDALAPWLRPSERLTLGGAIERDHLVVTLEVACAGREEVHTFEASIAIDPAAGLDVVAARAILVEFHFAMLDEYLRAERWPRPHLDWLEYGYEGNPVWFRGRVENEVLDQMADALLAKAESEP